MYAHVLSAPTHVSLEILGSFPPHRHTQGVDINGKGIPVDFTSECSYPGDALACVPPDALR